MISEPKAFASLTAGLLARKGGARPAMRRQPLGLDGQESTAMAHDDLGWNDMGCEEAVDGSDMGGAADLKPLLAGAVLGGPAKGSRPQRMVPEVRRRQAELAARISSGNTEALVVKCNEIAPKKYPKKSSFVKAASSKDTPVSAVRARDKAAFTLRLDADRHLALRLASAVTNQSSQAIMTRLLDEYLASAPEIGDLAGRVPAVPPARSRKPR